ncbi:MAG: phosphotyrosine protein phosphatase [Porticoccus sp.]|nr:MAG: phosphotyrosine protein phosphatase [Porticoccus sp.]
MTTDSLDQRADTGSHLLSPLRILVLCTGNSARSIMAEALFNTIGSTLFRAYSAGSKPTGRVNPLALEQIRTLADSAPETYRSKSWQEFIGTEAPVFDVILTVCDNAAAEDCPLLDGKIEHVHWGLPDPAAIHNDPAAARRAFTECFASLKKRIQSLLASPGDHHVSAKHLLTAMKRFE